MPQFPPEFLKRAFTAVRNMSPAFDHLVRAWQRYSKDNGGQLAASVTYYGFLSFFPLIALAFSVLGYVVAHDPSISKSVEDALEQALPGIVGHGSNQIDVGTIAAAKAGAGIIGLLGLLYAGLGWVDAMRQALRQMWHQEVNAGNVVVRKFWDVVVLVGLGVALLASVLLSSGATTATNHVLDWLGLSGSTGAKILIKVLVPILAVGANVAIFGWLFTRLARSSEPRGRVLRGALLMAVLFEALKQVGAFYLHGTTSNAMYGTFAAVVGLLVWINIVSRLMLLCAAWIVTAPYDSDRKPSGTANGTADASQRNEQLTTVSD
ncbi:MAG: YihY/virulence factor BrkB family protein [Actinomycetes bacterium]